MPKCSVSKLIATYHTKTDQKERERERETDKRERERERERDVGVHAKYTTHDFSSLWHTVKSTVLTGGCTIHLHM